MILLIRKVFNTFLSCQMHVLLHSVRREKIKLYEKMINYHASCVPTFSFCLMLSSFCCSFKMCLMHSWMNTYCCCTHGHARANIKQRA